MAFFILNAVQETTSRLAWSFARDNGLIFSAHLEQIHPYWQVPVWSLLLTWAFLAISGCIYLASSTGTAILVYFKFHQNIVWLGGASVPSNQLSLPAANIKHY